MAGIPKLVGGTAGWRRNSNGDRHGAGRDGREASRMAQPANLWSEANGRQPR